MNRKLFIGAALLLGVSISLTLCAERAGAQGPAGAGATAAAQSTSHSLNPIKWVKKDPRNSTDSPGGRTEVEKSLTPGLRTQGVLAPNATATEACAPFTSLDGCLAALHVSHNLGVDFNCLRAAVTGVHITADMSGCKVADAQKALGLSKAVHQMKPDVDSKQATREAEQQARDDLKGIGS